MSGEKIREQRMLLNLSQSQLSRKAHISRYKLNVFEVGGPPLDEHEIDRIRQALCYETQLWRHKLTEIDCAVEARARRKDE